MVTGRVNDLGEAIVVLRVKAATGHVWEYDAVVDTGFSGFVALPPEIISSLQWRRIGNVHVLYGEGSEARLPLHEALIEWNGSERTVEVDSLASEVLLGTALLAGHELRIGFVRDGVVEIVALT